VLLAKTNTKLISGQGVRSKELEIVYNVFSYIKCIYSEKRVVWDVLETGKNLEGFDLFREMSL
jgi:hypothetical protein